MRLPFGRLLIANRGEIACRVIRTAAALGLETVAVYSDADRGAAHVRMADVAVRLGPPAARDSYLRADAVVEAAVETGSGAVHPGYGFLSEDAEFARSVEEAGLRFVGPTPQQLGLFGLKHRARAAAAEVDVPMLAGSGVLADLEEAADAAARIGYPVMLKATGGGGGIGILSCAGPDELASAFERVTRVASASFRAAGVFVERRVERARHVEVQVVGDGLGGVVTLGDRDCSLQRRNQKVVEEAPAPGLSDAVRSAIAEGSARLCASVGYRSVGTVEFVYDAEREEAAFLEVNTRLQVEHPVTEEVWGTDLVAVMLRIAGDDRSVLDELRLLRPAGCAIEARVYAEDPVRDHQPSPGLITSVSWPEGAGLRVDGWIEPGTEVSPAYDPLLAKLIAAAPTRPEAIDRLAAALRASDIGGIETNLGYVVPAVEAPEFRAAAHHTATLEGIRDATPRIDVLRGGTQTTVQSWPGRTGLWAVGVPPSGPMDDRAFRAGNLALGNPEGAAGLEATLTGPALRFAHATRICVTGAPAEVTVDGAAVPMGEPVPVAAGAVLDVGAIGPPGLRAMVLVAGGLAIPDHLGSPATFTLGGFGGHGGRALVVGDVLHPGPAPAEPAPASEAPRPVLSGEWLLEVVPGPHAAPEFFTDADISTFYATRWEVHFNSARTGVRLVGPRPEWARPDGGEAGLHPSNIHDTPYAVGAVDFTGDLPIILGPDGPSLGGFVCPATVTVADRWKLGQLRPGDTVRFAPAPAPRQRARPGAGGPLSGVLERRAAADGPEVTYRADGDDNLLVEYGPMVLDLALRARVHALAERIAAAGLDGVVDLTAGVRSLQVHFDPAATGVGRILDAVGDIEGHLPPSSQLEVPSREVNLPLCWDDPATREAIARYMAGVRDDAPWCPWNIEFIRRVNGLADVEEVRRIVFDASYLVLGLGDVYLGAPVATPVDPRHRLVTTKYNPARTWTAENSVGIGGSYLCIYGMEGPGGYQFVGRTIQVWSRWRQDPPFEPGVPWLLRPFDRIRWFPVDAGELLDARADMAAGRLDVDIRPGTFRLEDHQRMLDQEAESITAFRSRQAAAFAAERAAWAAAGEFEPREEVAATPVASREPPPGGALVVAPMAGNVWKVGTSPGRSVRAGEVLAVLEAMKTETTVVAPTDGVVAEVLVVPGEQVASGSVIAVLGPA